MEKRINKQNMLRNRKRNSSHRHAVVDEQRDDVLVAVPRRHVQRRVAVQVLERRVDAGLEQRAHRRPVAPRHRQVQRRLPDTWA